MSDDVRLDPEALDFWLKKDPTCPIKATADGGLLIFLASDYAIEIAPGGRIACKGPDHYEFRDITLINGMPMEGNTADRERPGAPSRRGRRKWLRRR